MDQQELSDKDELEERAAPPTAFSLRRFIPLLQERIWVINPFTRQFLVGWITLLDSIPDLELVTFLPDFLGGLLRFLSDPNRDVHVATRACLDKFLSEIKRISRIKKGIAESKKSREGGKRKREESVDSGSLQIGPEEGDEVDSQSDDDDSSGEEDWVPGQDVQINYRKILEILTATLDSPLGKACISLRYVALARITADSLCDRGGLSLGVAAMDSRVLGHLPRRGATIHSQSLGSYATCYGQWC